MNDPDTILLLVGLFTVIFCIAGAQTKQLSRSLLVLGLTVVVVCFVAAVLLRMLR